MKELEKKRGYPFQRDTTVYENNFEKHIKVEKKDAFINNWDKPWKQVFCLFDKGNTALLFSDSSCIVTCRTLNMCH